MKRRGFLGIIGKVVAGGAAVTVCPEALSLPLTSTAGMYDSIDTTKLAKNLEEYTGNRANIFKQETYGKMLQECFEESLLKAII